jgi:hypothetical protein
MREPVSVRLDRLAYAELRGVAVRLSAVRGRRVTNSEALRDLIRAGGSTLLAGKPSVITDNRR